MDFNAMSNDDLTAALNETREKAAALFALDSPTIEQVNEAEALVASVSAIEGEQSTRAAAVADAEARFAAARATFTASGEEDEAVEDDETVDEEDDEDDEEVELATEDTEEDAEDAEEVELAVEDDEKKKDEEESMTASMRQSINPKRATKASAAKRVGSKTKRPAVAESSPVTITAAADVQGFAAGQRLGGMEEVAKAVQARVSAFGPYNEAAARAENQRSGGREVLQKFGAASFGVSFDEELRAGRKSDGYAVAQKAIKQHKERLALSIEESKSGKATLTAAGWCAPSPYVYNWIADYVVDGLITIPEISAPRGGLQITTGPALAQTTYADVDDFGFGGTEADAEAGFTGDGAKTCETIECPDFTDHRLDYSGYCWKIPILTEKAYPELVADALRLSNVLYAHKMNKRFISDIVAGSTAKTANGLGGSVLDTLEGLVQVAVKERRWWNIGENATMEVKLPQVAREIFKFDMARRSGLALNDIATDQKIAAYFANHNLAVEYVSDFEDLTSGVGTVNTEWPDAIRAIMYPAGTWAKAVEEVINLSAVYDAASLSQNEYTGVFFEQGVMTLQMGYRSHVVTVPVCVSGTQGANAFECAGSL